MTTEAAESTAAGGTATQAPTEAAPDTSTSPDQQTGGEQQPPKKAPTPANPKKAARQAARDAARRVSDQYQAGQDAAGGRETAPEGAPAGESDTDGRSSAERRERAAEAARERARAQDGKFLPDDDEGRTEQPPDEVAASDQKKEGSSAEPGTDDGADNTAPGLVRIPLPENHPLRDQGMEYIEAPKGQERQYRAMVNGAARRADVEAAERRAEELETKLRMREVESEWYAQGGGQLTPRELAVIEDNRRAYGDEAAEIVKDGILSRKRKAIEGQQQQAARQVAQERLYNSAVSFRNSMASELRTEFPDIQPDTLDRAFHAYGIHVATLAEQGQPPALTKEGFFDIAKVYLNSDPAVRRRMDAAVKARNAQRQKEADERAKREATKREEERLRDAAARHGRNPKLGHVPTGARTSSTEPAKPDTEGMSPREIREAARERALERARSIAGR